MTKRTVLVGFWKTIRRNKVPVYEYQHCDSKELVIRSIDEKEKTPECKECHEPMIRVFGVGAVTFMGIGWGKDA